MLLYTTRSKNSGPAIASPYNISARRAVARHVICDTACSAAVLDTLPNLITKKKKKKSISECIRCGPAVTRCGGSGGSRESSSPTSLQKVQRSQPDTPHE
ncbi:Hypothetical protein CINCED_3A003999 [Cinara cedri]|uniref:Uncharacterized protein n=1 Tax=Cinara cedri TaxID=506608 RepID=A0A5E4N8D9_9HEMI|nr:Hypothetical protein CINCED_3A003999 [Cinara cedri]